MLIYFSSIDLPGYRRDNARGKDRAAIGEVPESDMKIRRRFRFSSACDSATVLMAPCGNFGHRLYIIHV